jgi:uncharacterized RDD family membrane protein YckC
VGVNLTDVEVVAAGKLASWGRRLAALMIDSVVLATIVTVTVLAAGVPLDEMNDRIRNGESLLILLLVVVPEAIYTTALIGSLNQTFGKMAVGIKVVDVDNRSPIGYRRAFTRWLATAFLWAMFWIPGIVDHLWPLRDDRNQTFHDKLARSLVVRT